jgi:hypothetical protein
MKAEAAHEQDAGRDQRKRGEQEVAAASLPLPILQHGSRFVEPDPGVSHRQELDARGRA